MIVIVKNLKRIGILLTSSLALVGIASVAFAAPSPGTIATGDSLHIIPVYQPVGSPEMYGVTASGTATSIGASASGLNSWFGASQDPTTGKSYVADGDNGKIWEINPSTGALSNAVSLTDGVDAAYPLGMAIDDDGKVYISYYIMNVGYFFGTLPNVTSGQITKLFSAQVDPILAMAFNPVTGRLYGSHFNFATGPIAEIDLSAATFTRTNLTPTPSPGITSFQFDSNGTLWYTSADEKLCSADIGALGTVQCNTLSVDLANKDRYPLLRVTVQSKTVTFDANGGTGTMPAQSASTQSALTQNSFVRNGYTFAGWSTSPSGTVAYADKANYPFTSSETLYAQWTATPVAPVVSAVSPSAVKPALANTGAADSQLIVSALLLSLAGVVLFAFSYRRLS